MQAYGTYAGLGSIAAALASGGPASAGSNYLVDRNIDHQHSSGF